MAADLPPDRFWEISPRLAMAEIEAVGDRLNREHDHRAWLAWHTAYLPRTKEPVTLESLLSGESEAEPSSFLAMRLSASCRGMQGVTMADHLRRMQ